MRKHPGLAGERAVGLRSPVSSLSSANSVIAAVQPLLEKIADSGTVESSKVAKAWEMYDMPEVRSSARQYSNAFSSAKLVLGRREVVGHDPVIVQEPTTEAESKAYELLQVFAGGPAMQTEFLDRMGTYFMVPGDMIAVGAYDPAHIADNKFANWNLWSTSEVRWDGQRVHIEGQNRFEELPSYIKHVRIWNRHPQHGSLSDSPVLSALGVLELINLYDDRLAAEALSRLIGAGVWMIPQGMSLPTSTGDPAGGTPQDFLRLLMEVGSIAVKDRRSAAAMMPILVEANAEDILAAKDSFMSFATGFDERIGELQEKAIRRWATGVDLPAESMLGLSQATHWNASLISEDKVQSFVIPSLRRGVGALTWGWLKPALQSFNLDSSGLEVWFDPSGIKTRVDLGDEAKWGNENFKVSDQDTLYALGLDSTTRPQGEELKRMLLLHMANKSPDKIPAILKELGIEVSPELLQAATAQATATVTPGATQPPAGRPGPQANQEQDTKPSVKAPGRTAQLSTSGD